MLLLTRLTFPECYCQMIFFTQLQCRNVFLLSFDLLTSTCCKAKMNINFILVRYGMCCIVIHQTLVDECYFTLVNIMDT